MIVKRNRPQKAAAARRIVKRSRPAVGETRPHAIVKRKSGVVVIGAGSVGTPKGPRGPRPDGTTPPTTTSASPVS